MDGGDKWITETVSEPYKAEHYFYPDQLKFEKKNINIFYLGPAWDDWSNESNAAYAALNGLCLRPNEEVDTGDISNASMIDEEFTNINMMLKYFKFGFGRTTDIVNEQIRNAVLTREQAIELVKNHDGVCSDRIIKRFTDYVGITANDFWEITNTYVNQTIFDIQNGQKPIPKFEVGVDYAS
jgi:hypothetical protein